MLMQGTPFIYQGQEIGMTNVEFAELSDYRDVEIYNYYRERLLTGKTCPRRCVESRTGLGTMQERRCSGMTRSMAASQRLCRGSAAIRIIMKST